MDFTNQAIKIIFLTKEFVKLLGDFTINRFARHPGFTPLQTGADAFIYSSFVINIPTMRQKTLNIFERQYRISKETTDCNQDNAQYDNNLFCSHSSIARLRGRPTRRGCRLQGR